MFEPDVTSNKVQFSLPPPSPLPPPAAITTYLALRVTGVLEPDPAVTGPQTGCQFTERQTAVYNPNHTHCLEFPIQPDVLVGATVSAAQSPKRTDVRGCETPRLASALAVVSPFVSLVQKVSRGSLASPPLFVYFEDFDQCILKMCSKTYLAVSDTILVVFLFCFPPIY